STVRRSSTAYSKRGSPRTSHFYEPSESWKLTKSCDIGSARMRHMINSFTVAPENLTIGLRRTPWTAPLTQHVRWLQEDGTIFFIDLFDSEERGPWSSYTI